MALIVLKCCRPYLHWQHCPSAFRWAFSWYLMRGQTNFLLCFWQPLGPSWINYFDTRSESHHDKEADSRHRLMSKFSSNQMQTMWVDGQNTHLDWAPCMLWWEISSPGLPGIASPYGKQDRDLLGDVPTVCECFGSDLCPWVHGLSVGHPLRLPGMSPQQWMLWTLGK